MGKPNNMSRAKGYAAAAGTAFSIGSAAYGGTTNPHYGYQKYGVASANSRRAETRSSTTRPRRTPTITEQMIRKQSSKPWWK